MRPDNHVLKRAVDQTVSESLFSFEDIKHRIITLKESISRSSLQKWAEKSGLIENSMRGKTILCLHAGNFPMVGIQDLLAVMMTGGRYIGKFSKKDPYLLESLIMKFHEHNLGEDIVYETNLENLSGNSVDAVLFAGSESSVPAVQNKLLELGIIYALTPLLVRKAHFSIAWIHDHYPETMEQVIDAAFRYAGKGCRSVSMVIAPFTVTSNSCNFTDYVESFWVKNPQKEKPKKSLYHHYAMNKALGIPQIWLDDFLIVEDFKKPDLNFVLQWIKGGEKELRDIIKTYSTDLQSIYSTGSFIGSEIENRVIESLNEAQKPPVWWRPDGTDSIVWLQNQVVPKT